jgi:hypothetical protein
MRLWMDTYNWILGPRSIIHNIPDPNDVPPERRDVVYRFLEQFYCMKKGYAAAQNTCSSVWLGYYYQCPINEGGTARIAMDMRSIGNTYSILPRRPTIQHTSTTPTAPPTTTTTKLRRKRQRNNRRKEREKPNMNQTSQTMTTLLVMTRP